MRHEVTIVVSAEARLRDHYCQSNMPDSNPEDSLDRDATQAQSLGHESSRIDSLDRGQTAAETPSSSSDISQFDEGWERAEETVSLDIRYQRKDAIGRGGMGEVYRAIDSRLKRPVAIKRLKGDLSRNRRAVERFTREAEAVARLNHYNIVQIYDVGHDQDGDYLVMELVEGESLAQRLKDSGPPDLDFSLDLTSQLCDALCYAHSQGIVHRDVKPANILISTAGVPKLTDFGLARLESQDHGQTRAGAVLGTIDFMAPEQHRDAHSADAKSDQWSLAATFYQMVTGEAPRVIRPERLPESVRDSVLRALEEDPAKRFDDCHAFRDALLEATAAATSTGVVQSDLTPGQCSQCRHVNRPDMTFCEACGNSLSVPCPACQQQIGVWATFCGQCGADVAKELDAKLANAVHQQKELDSLRRSYRHAEAIAQLEPMSQWEHPAFEAQREWASKALAEYRDELALLEKQRDEILETASQRMNRHDVEGTLQLLERIPEPLSNGRIDALRTQAETRAEEIRVLGDQIRSAVASRQLDGLLPKVEQFLQLRPHDEKAKKLQGQLEKRQQRNPPTAAVVPQPKPNHSSPTQATPANATPAQATPAQAHAAPASEPFFGTDVPAPSVSVVSPKKKRHRSSGLGIAGAAIGMVMLVAGGVYLISNGFAPDSVESDSVDMASVDRDSSSQNLQPEVTANLPTTSVTADSTQVAQQETEADAGPANSAATGDSSPRLDTTASSGSTSDDAGWIDLINGLDLTGWSVGYTPSTKLRRPDRWWSDPSKASIGSVGGDHDYLITDDEYENYTLELLWRFAVGFQPKGNGSGVILHSTGQNAEFDPVGIEIDLLKFDVAQMEANRRRARANGGGGVAGTGCFLTYGFSAKNHSGAADGLIGVDHRRHLDWLQPPKLSSLDNWNHLSVTSVNGRLLVRINDRLVNEAWDLSRTRGHICLRSQDAAVEFRDVRLKHHESAEERDKLLLQGKWIAVGQEIAGKVWPQSQIDDHKKSIEFRGDQFEIRYGWSGQTQIERGTYHLIPKWTPAFIDMTGTVRSGKRIEFNGIYQFDQENLKHCFVKTHEDPTRVRPNRFSTRTGQPEISTTYVRDVVDSSSLSPSSDSTTQNPTPTSNAPREVQWTKLFNGRNLDGWSSLALDKWMARDDLLICLEGKSRHRTGPGEANLYSVKTYDNFVLRLEYRLFSGGNSGVYLRVPRDRRNLQDAIEIQLLDDQAPNFKNVKAVNRSGAIWNIAGPNRSLSLPAGDWNQMEIEADGPEITVTLNGSVAARVNLDQSPNVPRTAKESKSGMIGLQKHTGRIEFRNIEIRELP